MTVFRLFFKILRRSISAIAMYIGIFLFIFSMGAQPGKYGEVDADPESPSQSWTTTKVVQQGASATLPTDPTLQLR